MKDDVIPATEILAQDPKGRLTHVRAMRHRARDGVPLPEGMPSLH